MTYEAIPLWSPQKPAPTGSWPREQCLGSLSSTDQEVLGFRQLADLSNGHAYHELPSALSSLPGELSALWAAAKEQTPMQWERRFVEAFAAMSGVSALLQLPFCRPCPTASNSIDLAATLLHRRRLRTALVEPTFDNLALLLRRRGVALQAIDENLIFTPTMLAQLGAWLDKADVGALFIVSPSNPTGRCLTPELIAAIAGLCARRGVVLVIDSSFRLFNRDPFDDVAILLRSRVSFLAFEDTGKSFPTLDTKASLVYASADLSNELEELYSEVYLCGSGLALLLLARAFELTRQAGIDRVLWSLVDQRRTWLRAALTGTGLYVPTESLHSVIGLEWLAFEPGCLRDTDICSRLEELGIAALTGRQFYWASQDQHLHQRRIRLSLMRPVHRFHAALRILGQASAGGGLFSPYVARRVA